MARFGKWYLGLIKNPPRWIRFVSLGYVPLVGYGMALRRDVVTGVLCAALVACVAIPTAAGSFEGIRQWSQRHPRLDAMAIAPILFVAIAYFFPHLPIWWCLAIAALVALPLGATIVVQRKRITAPSDSPDTT